MSWTKQVMKRTVHLISHLMVGFTLTRRLFEETSERLSARTAIVTHRGLSLEFATPNRVSKYRVDTFATKEPETLEWIDEIEKRAVVWDIGANVGLYTCYAAGLRGARVVAFEPSVFNLELLARNIALNRLTSVVTIVPLPLSDVTALGTLNMTTIVSGGAGSTFGREFGHDGLSLDIAFRYPTVSISMRDARDFLGLPSPDHVKMDVDGIEHLILRGGAEVLQTVKSVMIEVNDRFATQRSECAERLTEAGFVLVSKRRSQLFDGTEYETSYNQLWRRTDAASSGGIGPKST